MADHALSPQQAAQALADLAGHEEAMHARAGALTGIVWGLVSGAIFVSYGLATTAGGAPGWVMAVLWLPWTLVGILLSVALWHLLSLSRGEPARPRVAIAWTGTMSLVFLAAILVLNALDLNDGAFVYMVAVNALVALGIMVRLSLMRRRLTALALGVVAVAMGAGAVVIGLNDWSTPVVAFASAGLCCGGYTLAGLIGFVRG